MDVRSPIRLGMLGVLLAVSCGGRFALDGRRARCGRCWRRRRWRGRSRRRTRTGSGGARRLGDGRCIGAGRSGGGGRDPGWPVEGELGGTISPGGTSGSTAGTTGGRGGSRRHDFAGRHVRQYGWHDGRPGGNRRHGRRYRRHGGRQQAATRRQRRDGGTCRASAAAAAAAAPAGAPCLTCSATILPISGRDVVYSAARNELYVSVAGDADAYPNTIVVVDPSTSSVRSAIPIGSDPGALALSDDGSTLWVAIDGAHAFRKVTMTSTPPVVGPLIHLPKARPDAFFTATSMAVLAGAPLSVAVVLSDDYYYSSRGPRCSTTACSAARAWSAAASASS